MATIKEGNYIELVETQAIEIAKLRKELAYLRITSQDYSCQCHNWIYTVDELHRELIEREKLIRKILGECK